MNRLSAIPSEAWVAIAILGRPRGNRGEVTAVSLSNRPERFQSLRRVYLFNAAGTPSPDPFVIEEVWEHKGALVFKFSGVDTISQAETLKNHEVRVPLAERVPLEAGEFFDSDLVGCHVVERASGKPLGIVAAVLDGGGGGLLELTNGVLVPFARNVCKSIDVIRRRIEVDLPDGLLELNQP